MTLPHRLLAAFMLVVLAGCAPLTGPDHAVTHFVLTDPAPIPQARTIHPGVLLVREMETSAFYQDARLAYSRAPGTRNHYEYANWSEAPARRLGWLLAQRLDAARVFATVAPFGSGVGGEYQLNTRLIDFYHDAAAAPGTALIVLEASLIRRQDARLVGRRVFVAHGPVREYSARGAADAMSDVANQVLDELVLWLQGVEVSAQK